MNTSLPVTGLQVSGYLWLYIKNLGTCELFNYRYLGAYVCHKTWIPLAVLQVPECLWLGAMGSRVGPSLASDRGHSRGYLGDERGHLWATGDYCTIW